MSEGRFEAKLYSLRKGKDGIIIGFVVHPNDVSPELLALNVGDCVMIGWSEIEEKTSDGSASERAAMTAAPQSGEETAAPSKPRRAFADLPLSQQCAIRCSDKQFWKWLSLAAAVPIGDEESAAKRVRGLLHVSSRSELDETLSKGDAWENMERKFKSWLTTQQHAETYR